MGNTLNCRFMPNHGQIIIIGTDILSLDLCHNQNVIMALNCRAAYWCNRFESCQLTFLK